jgi:hypothetical protein
MTSQSDFLYYPPFELFSSFALGFLISPWTWGVFWILVFFILWEILYVIYHRNTFTVNDFLYRLLLIFLYLFGVMLGIYIFSDNDITMRKDINIEDYIDYLK